MELFGRPTQWRAWRLLSISRTHAQHLGSDALRRQRPAVGCFPAAGPGRLVKVNARKDHQRLSDSLLRESYDWGGRFGLKKQRCKHTEKATKIQRWKSFRVAPLKPTSRAFSRFLPVKWDFFFAPVA